MIKILYHLQSWQMVQENAVHLRWIAEMEAIAMSHDID